MADDSIPYIGDRRQNLPQPGNRRPGLPRRHGEPELAHDAADLLIDGHSVLGLSLPPQAEAALAALTAEIEKLRADLLHAHGHEHRLEEEKDHHPLLPVLHRRAFHGQLNRVLGHTSRADVPGCLLWLHFPGLSGLRGRMGLAAADAALVHVSRRLGNLLNSADPLGYFEEGDFVVAMLLGAQGEGEVLRQGIGAGMADAIFAWGGARIDCRPEIGLVSLPTSLDADALLAAAAESAYGSGVVIGPAVQDLLHD